MSLDMNDHEGRAQKAAREAYMALVEISKTHGVRFTFGGCCACGDTTLDADVFVMHKGTLASCVVFMGDLEYEA